MFKFQKYPDVEEGTQSIPIFIELLLLFSNIIIIIFFFTTLRHCSGEFCNVKIKLQFLHLAEYSGIIATFMR